MMLNWKSLITGYTFISLAFTSFAQVETPELSPRCTFTQSVGLTDIAVDYSRPSKRNRIVFGNVVPYNEIWRLGANKNSTIDVSDDLYFGSDTLSKGAYALFAFPGEQSWELVFYKETSNWGTPDTWDESKVACRLKSNVISLSSPLETMTISIADIGTKSATLNISWDQVSVSYAFELNTESQVVKSIESVMSGPSSSDYYKSAKYYLVEGLDAEKALVWINQAIELRGPSAYWMTRVQAELYASLGKYPEAIEAAKRSLEAAKKSDSARYMDMNEKSIIEWTKKK
jgi:tetratricopeptide (TPR) repeat protein